MSSFQFEIRESDIAVFINKILSWPSAGSGSWSDKGWGRVRHTHLNPPLHLGLYSFETTSK